MANVCSTTHMTNRRIISTRRAVFHTVFVTTVLLVYVPLSVEGSSFRGRGWSLSKVPSSVSTVSPFSRRTHPNNGLLNINSSKRQRIRQQSAQDDEIDQSIHTRIKQLRAGGSSSNINHRNNLEENFNAIASILTLCSRTILPPIITTIRATATFYKALPTDAIVAQAGLVYCFAGGYYPTVFAALAAAQHCGWFVMVRAVDDLCMEASCAMEVATDIERKQQSSKSTTTPTPRDVRIQQAKMVLSTIDPMKINQAMGALYTTWMGISSVLEREFAKTIALSLTIVDYLRPLTRYIIEPPIYMLIPDEYCRWVPVLVGWGCKVAATSVAWRLQRIATAYTSAITGGLMFVRATRRMLSRRTVRVFGFTIVGGRDDDDDDDDDEGNEKRNDEVKYDDEKYSSIEELIGFVVAGIGLHSQIGNGFKMKVPYPISLVTWPFDILEKWIQWQITKDKVSKGV